MNMTERINVRTATPGDADAIAEIWHEGWPDGHLGHVPAELVEHRRLTDFRRRVSSRLSSTIVATVAGAVVGFVTVVGDEIEQLYVSEPARGSGCAAALLRRGEEIVARDDGTAWLAVVAGNARARRFYERQGWSNSGPFETAAEIDGGTIAVPALRYVKRVDQAADVPSDVNGADVKGAA